MTTNDKLIGFEVAMSYTYSIPLRFAGLLYLLDLGDALRVCRDSMDDIEVLIMVSMMELIVQVMAEDAISCQQHENMQHYRNFLNQDVFQHYRKTVS